MEYHDFSKNNKHFFSSYCEWQKLLSEFESAKHFIDNLGFLSFGKDMGIIRSAGGFRPVHINSILQSAAQTLQSMIACSEYGNIADVHMLLRKLRDDLFFYLYVIYYACRGAFTRGVPKAQVAVLPRYPSVADFNMTKIIFGE